MAASGTATATGAAPACGAPALACSWLTSNPDAMQAWLQLRDRPPAGAADLVRHLQGGSLERRGTAGAARPLDLLLDRHEELLRDLCRRRHLDLPGRGHVGWLGHGRHDGPPRLGRAPHVGHGLRRRLDDEPSWRLRPLACDARKAHRRRERLVAAPQRRSHQHDGADGAADDARPPSHAGQVVLHASPPVGDHAPACASAPAAGWASAACGAAGAGKPSTTVRDDSEGRLSAGPRSFAGMFRARCSPPADQPRA